MKFHCDRCKTRYSISEDRVRGKILKIRCKNCSSVITVREPSASKSKDASKKPKGASKQAAKREPRPSAGQEALAGAFREAAAKPVEPAAADSGSSAPASLEAEWYLAIDGNQEGPFTLEAAQTWIRGKASNEDIHCWSEGFDDWLPLRKVSHFRNLRQVTIPDSGDDADEKTVLSAPQLVEPKPLFAPTMAAVVAKTPGAKEELSANPMLNPKPIGQGAGDPFANVQDKGPDDDLEFDIGEASRVVSLPMLLAGAQRTGAAEALAAPGLPGIEGNRLLGRGSGSELAQPGVPQLQVMTGEAGDAPRPEVLVPRRSKHGGHFVLFAVGGAVLASVVGVLIYMASTDDTGGRVARGAVGGSGNLGYSFQKPNAKGKGKEAQPTVATEPVGTNRKPRHNNRRRPITSDPKTVTTTTVIRNPGEVDLSGGGNSDKPTGPLDGSDISRAYSKNQLAIKMCFERALKRNPLLKVPKTFVSIRVGANGKVSSVTIPSLAGTDLGSCMTSRIKRWKFRKSTEDFSSRFPVVFNR